MKNLDFDRFSARATRIQKTGGGAIDGIRSVDLVLKAREQSDYFLTGPAGLGDAPDDRVIHARDFSTLLDGQRGRLVENVPAGWRTGVTKELGEIRPSTVPRDYARDLLIKTVAGAYSYTVEMTLTGSEEPLPEFLHAQNAVELTSSHFVGKDGARHVPQALVGAFRQYAEKLRSQGVADPVKHMKEQGLKFAVSSTGGGLPWRGAEKPVASWSLERPALRSGRGPFAWAGIQMPDIVSYRGYGCDAYSIEQIERMMAADPALASGPGLQVDHAHFQRFMSDPDLFAP
jgi:hypothetical protein